MASSWGSSWGSAWGNAWGSVAGGSGVFVTFHKGVSGPGLYHYKGKTTSSLSHDITDAGGGTWNVVEGTDVSVDKKDDVSKQEYET